MNSSKETRSLAVLQKAIGFDPITILIPEYYCTVDQKLAVVGKRDLQSLERSGRRALKIDSIHAESAPMTGTFEFAIGGKPARRASEMRADRGQGIKTFRLSDDPNPIIVFVFLVYLTDDIIIGKPCLKRRWWFIENTGKHHAECSDRRRRKKHKKRRPPCNREAIPPADAPDATVVFRRPILFRLFHGGDGEWPGRWLNGWF